MRLDALLVERGLFPSKARAAAAVLAGDVVSESSGVQLKPGQRVTENFAVRVKQRAQFVSRGGEKLAAALQSFSLHPTGWECIDVGASTGGFTDCLLQNGAKHVVAIDVGYGQLAWRLRQDERVTVLERLNVRATEPQQLPYRGRCAVVDVSFIGLAKILSNVFALLQPDCFDCLCMIKPQFELPREDVSKGGVVRDLDLRRKALTIVANEAQSLQVSICGFASSGLPGPKGNRETFIWLAEPGREGALTGANLQTAILDVPA